jgi:hypothetical protein
MGRIERRRGGMERDKRQEVGRQDDDEGISRAIGNEMRG